MPKLVQFTVGFVVPDNLVEAAENAVRGITEQIVMNDDHSPSVENYEADNEELAVLYGEFLDYEPNIDCEDIDAVNKFIEKWSS